MEALAVEFEAESGHEVVVITGSTGKHYAQIKNGAPFDAFFAADSERPKILETELIAVSNTRFTYAIGQLVLWSPDPNLIDSDGTALKTGSFRRLSIANPRLAPYGRAAQEVLENLGLWESAAKRIVRGENISQAMHFVQSGNADLGLLAYSQI
ncbi:UNVERIFIED_CONTAM: hypothetical protein GTU68_033289, partial [Idotea baltica]|nr:hypothetical protein [Idotea baltica]